MILSIEEAIEFFAKYGGVTSDRDKLRQGIRTATRANLDDAVRSAVQAHGQWEAVASAARDRILAAPQD